MVQTFVSLSQLPAVDLLTNKVPVDLIEQCFCPHNYPRFLAHLLSCHLWRHAFQLLVLLHLVLRQYSLDAVDNLLVIGPCRSDRLFVERGVVWSHEEGGATIHGILSEVFGAKLASVALVPL